MTQSKSTPVQGLIEWHRDRANGAALDLLPFEHRQAAALLTSMGEERDRLKEALEEGRRAIGNHWAPNDCYATGPVTGDTYRDLVECPACAFLAKFDALTPQTEAQSHD